MTTVLVTPGDLHGKVAAPGSKSFTQRALLVSAFSSTPLMLRNVAFCDDDMVSAEIAGKCGINVARNGSIIRLHGKYSSPDRITVGESGTSFRLVTGLLSGKRSVTEIGISRQLSERPIIPLLNSLSERGLKYRLNDLTLQLDASSVTGGPVEINASQSSQFVSSLILFQSLIGGGLVRVGGKMVSRGYIDLTASILSSFGPIVDKVPGGFYVSGEYHNRPVELVSEGDFSSASFLLVAGLLSSDSGIVISGLRRSSIQPDASILDLLPCKGTSDNGEEYLVSREKLQAVTIDANATPDLAPPIATLGIFSDAGCRILNPDRLRLKESDRYADIISLAQSFGAKVDDSTAILSIRKGSTPEVPERLEFSEHRMIMAGIIAGIAAGKPLRHSGVEKISKSYPSFLSDLRMLGAGVEFL